MNQSDMIQAPGPELGPHAAVSGLQWGDEGKGKVVDLLTRQYDCIVRYNGGANAGHSVVIGDERYALHLLPSGILSPGKTNIIANGVVIEPSTLIDEVQTLRERGVEVEKNLRISSRAHLVMPYHMVEDALLEAAVTAVRGEHKRIGTTGRGIGPAYADKKLRTTGLRVGDLLDPDRFRDKLRHVVRIKNATLAAMADLGDHPWQDLNPDHIADAYIEVGEALRPHICDTTDLLHREMASGKRVLFEGANGSMLDIDHGTYPYVTSSNCGAVGVAAGAGVPGRCVGRTVGILKAYTTRVGAGPFATELHDEVGDRIRDRGNEFGTTTGRPRRCGWPDLNVVRYAAAVNGATELALMLLDVLAGFDQLKVCIGYKVDGKPIDAFPAHATGLEDVEPVYQTIPGFAEEIDQCNDYDELPDGAKGYIALVEQFVGVPVTIVSVGPKRSQTIVRQAPAAATA